MHGHRTGAINSAHDGMPGYRRLQVQWQTLNVLNPDNQLVWEVYPSGQITSKSFGYVDYKTKRPTGPAENQSQRSEIAIMTTESSRWRFVPRSRALCIFYLILGLVISGQAIVTFLTGSPRMPALEFVAAFVGALLAVVAVVGLIFPRLRRR